GWAVVAPDLRGTGADKIANDPIGGAPDHNSAEHAVWIGRPLLGQWTVDALTLVEWMGRQPGYLQDRRPIVGFGQAGVVALTTSALAAEQNVVPVAVETLASFVTDRAYVAGTRMGVLANGILKV